MPRAPLICRFDGWVSELIHGEFGDCIMRAIDFKMDLTRAPNPAGERVGIAISGKSLHCNSPTCSAEADGYMPSAVAAAPMPASQPIRNT